MRNTIKTMSWRPKKILLRSLGSFVTLAVIGGPTLLAQAGNHQPPVVPSPTFSALDEIPPTWSRRLPADDGDPDTGCGSSRFDCVLDGGAVLDKETGVVWEQSPAVGIDDAVTWLTAHLRCNDKTVGGRKGWRLPLIQEVASLVDPGSTGATRLPDGHPFAPVLDASPGVRFWAATTSAAPLATDVAWVLELGPGTVKVESKAQQRFYWCVRGNYGPDAQ